MSLNSRKMKIQFSFSLYASISELYHAENPIKIEHGSHFTDAQNNQIQRKLNYIFGST